MTDNNQILKRQNDEIQLLLQTIANQEARLMLFVAHLNIQRLQLQSKLNLLSSNLTLTFDTDPHHPSTSMGLADKRAS
jgi:hypothetical protein